VRRAACSKKRGAKGDTQQARAHLHLLLACAP